MNALETIRTHYEERDLAARRWKKDGGKVVGYISDDVPEEMILAAGLFPFRMSGDPMSGTAEADKYTESFYDPSVRSILNMLLTGRYDFLDFMIIPHHSDAVLKLYHQMYWIHRLNAEVTFPPVHLFDVLHTRFLSAGLYIRQEVDELKKRLEEWSGRVMSDESLAQAIEVVNENRRLLKEVAKLRTLSPSHLSGVDALRLIGTSAFMLKEEHNRLLKEVLASADALPEGTGTRIYVEGSSLDNLQLYKIIESCGATVVAEGSTWGNSYFQDLTETGGDPLEAIAERYHLRPSRYRIASLEQRVTSCVENLCEAGAEAAVFYLLEWDPAPAWDQPNQQRALNAKGIDALHFADQKYALSEEITSQIRAQVEAFIAGVRIKNKAVL